MDPLARFEFSQSSLQDFVDCRKRFQLRYLQHVAWPAVQAEPARENERHIQRGERFHRLAQQYLVGVPQEKLARMAEADEDQHLKDWWQNFLEYIPDQPQGARHVEITLETRLGRFRLMAKYDLVLIEAGNRALIYDWKTSTRRPSRARLQERLQTRIYPYVLAQAGAVLNQGRAFAPEQIEMIYWFTEPDQAPERFTYSRSRMDEDEQYLLSQVEQILALKPEEFTMAESAQGCGFCTYRSLCGRGVQAADMSSATQDNEPPEETGGGLDFDLEQIGEISF